MTNGEPPNLAMLWPSEGGRRSVGAGQILIDFQEGKVRRETGDSEDFLTSLTSLGQPYVRAVLIEVDENADIQFDGGAKYTISAGEISRIIHTQFLRLTITVTKTTQVRVWGSTHPLGVPEKFSSSILGGVQVNTTSQGHPMLRPGRLGSTLGSYRNIASYTVPPGTQLNLREIAFGANIPGSVNWKLRIAGVEQFRNANFINNYSAPFPDDTLNTGTFILIQGAAIGGTYKAVAVIAGKTF